MPLNKIWLDDEERRRQVGSAPPLGDGAFFGFERIHAREKTERVLRHFNSVAHVYDFMNTPAQLRHPPRLEAGIRARAASCVPGTGSWMSAGGPGTSRFWPPGGWDPAAGSSSTTSTAP